MTAASTCDAPNCANSFDPLDPQRERYTVNRNFLSHQTFDTCSVICLSRLVRSWTAIRTEPLGPDKANITRAAQWVVDKLTFVKVMTELFATDPSDTSAQYQSILDGEGVIVPVEQLHQLRDTLGAVIDAYEHEQVEEDPNEPEVP